MKNLKEAVEFYLETLTEEEKKERLRECLPTWFEASNYGVRKYK